MTAAGFVSLAPYLVLTATAVIVMLAIAIRRSHPLTAGLTLAGLALSFLALPFASSEMPEVTPLLTVDGFALFFAGLLLAAAIAVAALAYGYFERRRIRQEEFYLLLLTATLGGSLLPASVHFASLFLSLELLSISLYAMIAFLRTDSLGIEAGLKYLVMGASTSAFLLFGAALIYTERGTLVLNRILLPETAAPAGTHPALLTAGLGMVLVAIGFKLAVVPFHFWAPDIYQGAPAPVAGYLATVSKGGIFAVLIRLFSRYALASETGVYAVLIAVAAVSMFSGNWLALLQGNVKRLLAYSSIAHFGYLLVALLAASPQWTVTASGIYLAAYFAAILAAFGVIGVISGNVRDVQELEEFSGLFWRRPWAAGVLSLALLSLIGIPITAGFIGKAYVLLSSVGTVVWLLALVLIITGAIGLYYYLRIILVMARAPETKAAPAGASAESRLANLTLAALAVGILWLGVYPTLLLDLIQRTASGLLLF
jgi:NADH-quinone oxidoreductase subunit N